MIFVCLDTNILVRVLSQGKAGCEIDHVKELASLHEKSKLCLLLPEVIELEFEKLHRSLAEDISGKIAAHKEAVQKIDLGTEIEDLGFSLQDACDKKDAEKRQNIEKHAKDMADLFSIKGVRRIPLTPEILVNGKRRMIAERMPKRPLRSGKDKEDKAERDNDALIIESLLAFFGAEKATGAQLYLCSANQKDFALEVKPENKNYPLHPLVSDGLPSSAGFTDLETLLKFAKEHKEIKEPTAEEIEAAKQREIAKARQTTLDYAKAMDSATVLVHVNSPAGTILVPLPFVQLRELQGWLRRFDAEVNRSLDDPNSVHMIRMAFQEYGKSLPSILLPIASHGFDTTKFETVGAHMNVVVHASEAHGQLPYERYARHDLDALKNAVAKLEVQMRNRYDELFFEYVY
jgi:hypothetical protein